MPEIKETPDFDEHPVLIKAFHTNKICLFIGAGVAQNLDMPSWSGFAQKIVEFCYKHELIKTYLEMETLKKDSDPIRSVSYCYSLIEDEGPLIINKYNDFLINLFYNNPLSAYYSKDNNSGTAIYNIIKELSKKGLLIQTNYDNVLEKITQRTPCYLSEMDFSIDPKQTIIYLHGKATEENDMYKNLVLTKAQYNELYILNNQRKEQHLESLRKIFSEYVVLFLGYSLNDIEIMQTIALANSYPGALKKMYLLTSYSKSKEIEHKIHKKYLSHGHKIETLFYNIDRKGYSIFVEVLEKLKQQVNDKIKPFDHLDEYLDFNNVSGE